MSTVMRGSVDAAAVMFHAGSMNGFAEDFVTQPDLLDAYARVTDAVGVLVDAVGPNQLDDPTPCTQWSVNRLITHLADVNHEYAELAESGAIPARTPDYPDAPQAFPVQVARARAAFARPGFFDTVLATPVGPQPGTVSVQHVINELTVHGWDLAKALGHSTDIVPDVAENSLASWKAFFVDFPRSAMSGNFNAEREAPDAPPADRLAAYLGRDLGWTRGE